MPAELMSALATVLGFAFLGDLTANEQNSLGNFLMLIAQVMITNATQQQLLNSPVSSQDFSVHEKRITALENALRSMQNGSQPSSSSVD